MEIARVECTYDTHDHQGNAGENLGSLQHAGCCPREEITGKKKEQKEKVLEQSSRNFLPVSGYPHGENRPENDGKRGKHKKDEGSCFTH